MKTNTTIQYTVGVRHRGQVRVYREDFVTHNISDAFNATRSTQKYFSGNLLEGEVVLLSSSDEGKTWKILKNWRKLPGTSTYTRGNALDQEQDFFFLNEKR